MFKKTKPDVVFKERYKLYVACNGKNKIKYKTTNSLKQTRMDRLDLLPYGLKVDNRFFL